MPDSMGPDSPEVVVASIIRGGVRTLTILMRKDLKGVYRIYEEGSDEVLESTSFEHTAKRLADMYLDGFREGYDRGYAAHETAVSAEHADPGSRNFRRPIRVGWRRPTEGDGRDRDDVQGTGEADRPGG